tara:strand:- start:2133 stop:2381 length:249 start_codon:yes stop_codon:yes gene_type:complete
MAILQFIRIDPDGKEVVLEETPVPGNFSGTCLYSPQQIEELEEHYKKTGKPKRNYVDAIYVTRQQVERVKDERSKDNVGNLC